MSQDTLLKDDAGNQYSFDRLATQKWLEGHEAGALKVAEHVMDRSLKAFSEGRDSEAILLRKLSTAIKDDLARQMRKRAEEHIEKYPYEGPFNDEDQT